MKLRLTAVILLSLCLSQAFADEGMWLLGNLRKNKQAAVREEDKSFQCQALLPF